MSVMATTGVELQNIISDDSRTPSSSFSQLEPQSSWQQQEQEKKPRNTKSSQATDSDSFQDAETQRPHECMRVDAFGVCDEVLVRDEDQNEAPIEGAATCQTGKELILALPLEAHQKWIIVVISALQLASGTTLILSGVIIHGVLGGERSSRDGPQLWWNGILPFLVGFCGIYAGGKKRRKLVWMWGMLSFVLIFLQTAIMGVIGDFTTSNYDVWIQMGERYNRPVCEQKSQKQCFCQDFVHGVLSTVEIPGVTYIYEPISLDDWSEMVKWRLVRFHNCSDVVFITRLYLSHMAIWGLFCLITVVGCIIAHKFSVCAKQDVDYFHRLKDSGEGVDAEQQSLTHGVIMSTSQRQLSSHPDQELNKKTDSITNFTIQADVVVESPGISDTYRMSSEINNDEER